VQLTSSAKGRIAILALTSWVLIVCFSQVLFGVPYSVSVTATAEKIASPGDFVTHVYTITNTGTSNDEYQLTITTPTGWLTLGIPSSIQVTAGASEKLFVTFVVPSTAQAGTYEAVLIATSTGDPSVTAQATALITISPVSGVKAVWIQEPPRAQPGETVQGTFSLTNTGNISDSYTIEVSSAGNCRVSLSSTTVPLFAGETTQITLTVSVPAAATPGSRYLFTLEIRSAAHPDIFTALVHSSRAAPPPPEKVGGTVFPLWPVTISFTFDESGFTSASFSGSGELEGFGTLSASTSLTATSLAVPTGIFSTDDWRISLAGGGVSGGFGSVSGEGTGITLFGKVGDSLSSQLVITENVKGFSISCRWTDGSLRIVAGSDVSAEYGFQEIQFSQSSGDAFSLTGSFASVNEQTSSGSAFRINPQVTVGEYRIGGSFLNVSPGFPNRNEEEAYSMTIAYAKSRARTQTLGELRPQQTGPSFGITAWSLTLDTSKVCTQSGSVTSTTSTKGITSKVILSVSPINAEIWFENKKSDDTPTTTNQSLFGLRMKIGGPLFGNGKYSFSATLKDPIDRIADTRHLNMELNESVSFSLGEIDITSSISLGRIIDLKTGSTVNESSIFSASLSLPRTESNPKMTLSVSNGSASLGIGLSWGDVSASVSIPLSEEGASFSASISTRFSLAIPFLGPAYGRVTGYAFVDANGNGLFDPGEEPIPSLLLTLTRQEAITGHDGRFAFWPVKPGTHELSLQELPFGLAPRISLPLSLNLSAGEYEVLLPFEQYSSISGIVYNDANQNGRRDAGESGIPGAIIAIAGTFGQKQTATSSTGRFNVRVEPGVVEVSLLESSLPKRFVPTTPTALRLDIGVQETKRVEFGSYQKPREIIFTFGPPTARFTITPSEPVIGAEVLFDASSSEAVGVELVSYDWTFQHGELSYKASGKQITERFSTLGTWLITLVVTDANGLKDDYQLAVVVK